MSSAPSPQLTLLYDGGCPLCLREVTFLRRRDQRLHPDAARLAFVDIDAADYSPNQHNGISYREAMGRIHAIQADGTVLRDVEVFRAASVVKEGELGAGCAAHGLQPQASTYPPRPGQRRAAPVRFTGVDPLA